MAQLFDHRGRPIERRVLTEEIAGSTLSGVRSPVTGYPADGLTPQGLGGIMKAADQGDPVAYMELAEAIEERDPHYLGVLGTRRRAVSQIEITVEAGSEDPADEKIAQMVRDWLKRDELQDELFQMLDCLGKGYSATEIVWDTSAGQWRPARLELRDPRHFRFDRADLRTPLYLGDGGQQLPLPAFKFIWATIPAKSGLPLRAGLARVAAWSYLFKKFTERDWAIFTQTYGHPLRLGKYQPGASDKDKATLMRAVANIAGDMAAIVPEGMLIEFVEAANVGAAHRLYLERADWLDRQVSKAVLGQTATTDAVTGGLGSGEEHGDVRRDIKRADARALAAVLNRDLIVPWVQLERGPQAVYPRLRIEEPEQEDLKALADALGPLIDRGLEVSADAILAKFGLPEAKPGGKLLRPAGPAAPATPPEPPASKIKRQSGEIKRGPAPEGGEVALQAEGPSAAPPRAVSPEDRLADRMAVEAAPAVGAILEKIEAMMATAATLEEFRAMLLQGFPDLPADDLAAVIGMGLVAAHAGGRIAAEEDAG